MVFEKTLTDIVKGIRASKRDTALYISSCIAEIKSEINATDPHTKTCALQKLTFLQMMGYNMSWASFATIEVMSSTRFAYKRIGYLAASQAFTQDTDVVLLTINTLKKELRASISNGYLSIYEAGLAVNCLSNIVTEDLARELLSEVTNLTSHPQPYLRKKAVLCLLKLFVKYPQGLRLTFGRIQECLLRDSDPSVVSCVVNVITELSDKNPKNYLILAPSFFALLTTSSNNWMLIKVVKLLGSLVAEEPRLARKLLEPLSQIVRSTQAKSLLYEAVYTITLSLPHCRKANGSIPSNIPSIVALCAKTLKGFLEEEDQNLKYLGLVGFGSLMVSHPKVLASPEYRPLILACLSDEDATIRLRALDLLSGVATKRNVVELVTQLLRHVELATGSYMAELIIKIVEICSGNKYTLIDDFAWYLDVLLILSYYGQGIERNILGDKDIGKLISDQLVDVTMRVLSVRVHAVHKMIDILFEGSIKYRNARRKTNDANMPIELEKKSQVMPEILRSAAWIIGEYSILIEEANSVESEVSANGKDNNNHHHNDSESEGIYHAVIQFLLDPCNVFSVAYSSQSLYIQASMKVLAAASNSCNDSEVGKCVLIISRYLPLYMQSMDTEIQERAFTSYNILTSLRLTKSLFDETDSNFLLKPIVTSSIEQNSLENDIEKLSVKEKSYSTDLLDFSIEPIILDGNPSSFISKPAPTEIVSLSSCKKISSTLRYLMIPELMKPINMKTRRKIRQLAQTNIMQVLEKPTNLFFFSKIFASEIHRRLTENCKSSLEEVNFIQQESSYGAEGVTGTSGYEICSSTLNEMSQNFKPSSGNSGSNIKEHHITSKRVYLKRHGIDKVLPNQYASCQEARLDHPFYLSPTNQNSTKICNSSNSRFGKIQLLDNDDESLESWMKKEKSKNNYKNISAADMLFLSGKNAPKTLITTSHLKQSTAIGLKSNQHICSSNEDDDDEEEEEEKSYNGKIKKKSSHLKGFEGLAMVDLTTPLGDNDVMRLKNRSFNNIRKKELVNLTYDDNHSLRGCSNKKILKLCSTSSEILTTDPINDTTIDLLGFGDLVDVSVKFNVETGIVNREAKQRNQLSYANRELLGLETPINSPLTNKKKVEFNKYIPDRLLSIQVEHLSNTADGLKLWQRTNINAVEATGSGTLIDWNLVSLLFKTHVDSNTMSAMLSLKLINHTSSTILENIQINLGHSIKFEKIMSGCSSEGKSRAGPFVANVDGISPTIRGILTASGWLVPFKVTLPSIITLRPFDELSEKNISNVLSNEKWFSFSTKFQIISCRDNIYIKSILKSFLHGNEVIAGGASNNNWILASKSISAAKMLVFFNVRKKSIKCNVKCTNKHLCKALASDLKRVVI